MLVNKKEKWIVTFRIFDEIIECDIEFKGFTHSGCGKTRLDALKNAYGDA